MSLEQRLVAALGSDDPAAELAAIPAVGADRARVADVVAALGAVREERARREQGILDALAAADVEASAVTVVADAPLLPDVTIRAAAGDRRRAVEVVEACGYRRLGPASAGAWESYQRTLPGAALVRQDESPGRVELRWSDGDGRPGHRLLHPDEFDWAAFDLPRVLWPLYHAIHAVRLPLRLFRRGARPPNLGPFLGTPRELIEPLLKYADLGPDDVLVDLGCGDARILTEAASSIGCHGRGIESNPSLAAAARARVEAAGVAHLVEIIEGDASGAAVEDADVVFLFLPVAVIGELVPRLQGELPPGARIVSHEIHQQSEPSPDDERVLTAGHAITVARRWAPR